jgi:hypothetical protein
MMEQFYRLTFNVPSPLGRGRGGVFMQAEMPSNISNFLMQAAHPYPSLKGGDK